MVLTVVQQLIERVVGILDWRGEEMAGEPLVPFPGREKSQKEVWHAEFGWSW